MTNDQRSLLAIAEIIRVHYDLGEVGLPAPLAATHQRRHRKLLVQTAAGDFLVKTYKRDPVVLDALRFQHNLSNHLDTNGLPVARIQRARNGKGIVEGENWAMELQEFVHGQAMTVTPETLAISADALGRFHNVCRDRPAPPRDTRMWRFSEVPRQSFAALFGLAQKERPGQEVIAQCNEIALFLHDAGRELAIEKRSEFETGLIHGDWHGGNLLFHEGRLAAILDLEFAGDGCYLEDIAYALSNLAVRRTVDPRQLSARANAILDNYQRHRELSYAEEAALYFAVGVKHITTVSYQMPKAGGTVAGLSPAEWLERLAAQCRWLKACARKVRWGE